MYTIGIDLVHTYVHVALSPSKDQVQVSATVTEHSRTAKVIVFKKKRRKQYKRKKGVWACVYQTCQASMCETVLDRSL